MSTYETETGYGEFEVELGEGSEFEYEGSEFEYEGSEFEALGEFEASPLNESEEIELAAELLEITSEQELEQFLGKVFKKVARGVGSFVKSPVGRALGGVLKSVAKKALPVVGGALGSMVAPGIGTAIGSKLGSLAGGLFEVELESMTAENAEYEVARRYVNLAAASARNAATARLRPGINPVTVARASVARAARTHAPGLHRQMRRGPARRVGRGGMVRPGAVGRPGVPTRPMPRPGMPRRPGYLGAAGVAVRGGLTMPDIEPAGAPSAMPDDGFEPDEPSMEGMAQSGRWVRRGRKIIVIGG